MVPGALRDATCTLLIGEDAGRKIGMVRLVAAGEETEVSINLNPAVRPGGGLLGSCSRWRWRERAARCWLSSSRRT